MTVKTLDKREALHQEAKSLHLLEFWKERADIELVEPRDIVEPHCWKWRDVEPRLRAAADIVPIEECERRALLFCNPGLGGKPYVTNTLFAAFSLYNPGEQAPVHRHTPSASRFIVEGSGGYTVVEGEKCVMHRGDLIITPAGTWHDHGNEGDEQLIWMDVLDVPIIESLNVTHFEFDYQGSSSDASSGHPMGTAYQDVSLPPDHSQRLYGTGGLMPLFAPEKRGAIGHHSPMFVYRWEKTRAALERLADYQGSPYDGVIMEYVNPATGQSVMPAMSFRSQMLRPGEQTLLHRHMSNAVYFCLEGSGYTEIDGTRVEWGRNDVFALPTWKWHRHVNTTNENAFLYSVTDEAAIRKLGLFREERKTESGDIELVIY